MTSAFIALKIVPSPITVTVYLHKTTLMIKHIKHRLWLKNTARQKWITKLKLTIQVLLLLLSFSSFISSLVVSQHFTKHDRRTSASGKKTPLLTGKNPDQNQPRVEGEALLLMAVWVKKEKEKGRQGRRGRTERGEEQCEHVKLSELQIELGLNPQVAVDKQ